MAIGTDDGNHYESEMHYQLDIPTVLDDAENRNKFLSQQQSGVEEPQNSTKKLYFVRHGEPHVIGWSQESLNDAGRKDAQKAAESAKDLPVTQIVSSDLPRAAETARIIANKNDLPIEYHPGLRTWNLGYLNGPSTEEKEKEINRLCTSAHDEVPKGGESFNQFKDRILSTVSDIMQKHNDKEIMVVSHSSPGKVLNAWTAAGQPKKKGGDDDNILGWYPNAPEMTKEVQAASSGFGKGLDPSLKADVEDRTKDKGPVTPFPYEKEVEMSKKVIQEANRERQLTIEFPDAFPPSKLAEDLGLEDTGLESSIERVLHAYDLRDREKHRQKDLTEQLGGGIEESAKYWKEFYERNPDIKRFRERYPEIKQ